MADVVPFQIPARPAGPAGVSRGAGEAEAAPAASCSAADTARLCSIGLRKFERARDLEERISAARFTLANAVYLFATLTDVGSADSVSAQAVKSFAAARRGDGPEAA